jgi:hypothetical protein
MDNTLIMDEDDEANYWHNLSNEALNNLNNVTELLIELKNLGNDIILKYSGHRADCFTSNNDCSCGFNQAVIKFKSIKV